MRTCLAAGVASLVQNGVNTAAEIRAFYFGWKLSAYFPSGLTIIRVVTCAPGFQAHAVATGSGQWQAGRFLRPCGFKLTKRERQLIRSPGKRYLPGFVNAHMTSAYTPGTPPHIR